MAFKIKRVQIKNFKVFKNFNSDFDQADLLLFDGPNGFGKTSFYDAVELLITGNIKRFERLGNLVDGRLVYMENPYLNAESPHGDIVIKAEIKVNELTYFISRKALNKDLSFSTDFKKFNLFTHDNFDEEDGEVIDPEKPFLEGLFGKDYRENFEFLNYVEQEDNSFLLKSNEKDKKQLISHLFNVKEFETQIAKYEALKKKLSELCNLDNKKAIENIAKELEDHKKSLKETSVKLNIL